MRKLLVRLFLSLLVVSAIATVVFLVFIAPKLREKHERPLAEYRATVEKHAGALCDDMRAVAASPIFPKTFGTRDAGPYLNPKVAWDVNPEDAAGLGIPANPALGLPPGWEARFKEWGPDGWIEGGRKVDVSTLNFGWMRDLRQFDHWDLMVDSPLAAYATKHQKTWLYGPIPNYLVLRDWAKLRLLHGLATGETKDAVEDVRHLAWLLYQSGTLIGPLIASNLIHLEQQVFDAAAPGSAARTGWTPTAADDVKRLKRVAKFFAAYTPATLPDPLVARIRSCAPPTAFPCSVDVEDAAMLGLLRPALEKEHPERYRRSENAIPPVAPHCAATVTAARNSVPMTLDDQIAMNGNSSPGEMWSMDYPFVRGYMGKILLAISITSSAERIETLYGDAKPVDVKPAAVP